MRTITTLVAALLLSGCDVLIERPIGDAISTDPAVAGVWKMTQVTEGAKPLKVSLSGKLIDLDFQGGGDDSRTTALMTIYGGRTYVMMHHPERSKGITGYAPLELMSRSATEIVLLAIDRDVMKACLATHPLAGRVKWMDGQAVLSDAAGKAILSLDRDCLY